MSKRKKNKFDYKYTLTSYNLICFFLLRDVEVEFKLACL